MTQYSGKVIAIDSEYKACIWAKAASDEKTDVAMSLLLAGLMADKTMLIQYNTSSTLCTEINQWASAVVIERVFIKK